MAEYVRRYVPCRSPLCWNVVFAWHGPHCSPACRDAWCLANGRTATSGPTVTLDVGQFESAWLNRIVAATGPITHRPAPAPTMADLMHAVDGLGGPPKPIKVTRQEWEHLKTRFPVSAPNPLTTGAIGAPLYGIPVEIIEPDPTPEPGWLKRLLRGLFG